MIIPWHGIKIVLKTSQHRSLDHWPLEQVQLSQPFGRPVDFQKYKFECLCKIHVESHESSCYFPAISK